MTTDYASNHLLIEEKDRARDHAQQLREHAAEAARHPYGSAGSPLTEALMWLDDKTNYWANNLA